MTNQIHPCSLYKQGEGLNYQYLTTLDNTVQDMLDDYTRVFALRVDLHLPDNDLINQSRLITRFISSLKAQLKAYESKRSKLGTRIYPNTLRYVWAREIGTENELEHYHLLLLFNKDAYHLLGNYRVVGTLANRIQQAWFSALGEAVASESGLVHFPKNGSYYIDGNSPYYEDQLDSLMYRASYLCKKQTKVISSRVRSFGASPRIVVKRAFS
ncbi:inovirus Gp2 family protein [Aliivibrio sp. S4TY2]|uniref:inovirus Gp2 family protein n=1 Tax=unclassified Aliivibrio TaxID=2645654 RepID=UPI002378249B|nr:MULTISPECIES: inovirus Gp2 family protein [unclassified Aliivibrio]MDD9155831.1 inovirus Gp2 family protein [Aliivibrio sp. S4TY2]MDD9159489.1 inovirus Gp2 family protein [Aliivibrio sp. S4TY1]MDD9163539.1 inovirus Gp2 family protein [Aliivibrio sp. S4MY2]MDD9167540.1 inovirus Gp2 family protein [Aliivibrio sp. S4MY4]MDD9186064.1 inovirus Gp2 family protein [Aliivibrio sp. S4MY3]